MRLVADGLVVAGNRLLEPIQQGQRHPAVGERDRVAGIDRQSFLIGRQRLVEALVLYVCVAAVDQGGDVAGLAGDHRIEAGQRLVSAIEIEQRGAAIHLDVGPRLRRTQCRIVARQGLGVTTELAEHDPAGIENVLLPRLLRQASVAG